MICKRSVISYGISGLSLVHSSSALFSSIQEGRATFSQKRFKNYQLNEYTTSCIVEYKQKPMSDKISVIKKLGKMRLTLFVAASSVAGAILTDASFFYIAILFLGVTSISLSANTANQCLEIKEDGMMNRTKLRPLVTGEISRNTALKLCAGEFFCGSYLLYLYSLESCMLGIFNWLLYVACYTPSKKLTIYNTEIGAIVGAIPPLMGGLYYSGLASSFSGAAWLGLILYLWQIPHFIALSFLCRKDYLCAGYQMQASFSANNALRKFLLYTVGLGGTVLGGPLYFGLDYPSVYYFSSSLLFTALFVKSSLFCYRPARYCRECFIFSYIWLGMQLLLIISSHYVKPEAHHEEHDRIEKLIE